MIFKNDDDTDMTAVMVMSVQYTVQCCTYSMMMVMMLRKMMKKFPDSEQHVLGMMLMIMTKMMMI